MQNCPNFLSADLFDWQSAMPYGSKYILPFSSPEVIV